MNNKHKKLRGEKDDMILSFFLLPVLGTVLYYFVKAFFLP